ncbi:MAG: chemotaxis protein CheW [Gammaproteobacteria bacterium]|nr:chemotaxis protein CheW [Gammaproteobacteria bacterium]
MSSAVEKTGDQIEVDESQEVRCLLIPQRNSTLMLPNTVVAEVTDYSPPETTEHSPDWLLGLLSWRGRNIPLISFENFFGGADIKEPRQVAVLNSLNGNGELPFMAITISDLPRLAQVNRSSIEYIEDDVDEGEAGPILARMNLSGEFVIIPNVDFLEDRVAQLGIQ